MKFHVNVVVAVIAVAACYPAKGQSLAVVPAPVRSGAGPSQIRIFCTKSYSAQKCTADSAALWVQLEKYPVSDLGQWSYALVPSEEWKALVETMGGNTNSPAF